MSRLIYDPKFDVYAGEHFDVEASAVERVRRRILSDRFGVRPENATPKQLAAVAAAAEDENTWDEQTEGVIPLHRCSGEPH